MSKKSIAILLVMLSGLSRAFAQSSITIPDYSFENLTAGVSGPTFAGLSTAGTNSATAGGWTVTAGASAGGLAASSVSVGTGTSEGGPTPAQGTYDAKIGLGAGIGTSAGMTDYTTASFQPNMIYTLTVAIDAGLNASILGQTYLKLLAGSTTVASLGGSSLVSLVDSSSGLQNVSFTYTTGATAPTGNVGVGIASSSVASLGGSIYLDNVQLGVMPVPEPQPSALIGLGVAVFAVVSRFRNRL